MTHRLWPSTHADRRARAIAADLSSYTTTAELHELAAILDRHDDTEAAEIRDLIDFTRAA